MIRKCFWYFEDRKLLLFKLDATESKLLAKRVIYGCIEPFQKSKQSFRQQMQSTFRSSSSHRLLLLHIFVVTNILININQFCLVSIHETRWESLQRKMSKLLSIIFNIFDKYGPITCQFRSISTAKIH